MDKNKRALRAVFPVFLCFFMFLCTMMPGDDKPAAPGGGLLLYYGDGELTEYLDAVCDGFYDRYGVRVYPHLAEGIDYLDDVKESGADMFLAPSTNLEEAYLMGLCVPPGEDVLSGFGDSARKAVEYNGRPAAFPLYYEVACLFYNRAYIEEYARNRLEAGMVQEAFDANGGEAVSDNAAFAVSASEEEVSDAADGYLPKRFSDLEEFAQDYDAPENVKGVFAWDTRDVFYDYFAIGGSLSLEGKAVDIVNSGSITGMQRYAELLDFFSIEEDRDYKAIRDGFVSGNYVFAILSNDALRQIDDPETVSVENIRVMPLPDMAEGVPSKSLSVTEGVLMTRACQKTDEAVLFMKYLKEDENVRLLYELGGKLSPLKSADKVSDLADTVRMEYERSMPAPRTLGLSDFWMQLEIAFVDMANGGSPKIILKKLENNLLK